MGENHIRSGKVRLQGPSRRARRLAGSAALALLLGAGPAGCGGARGAGPAAASPGAAAEIIRELEASADRWNEGDLEGFLRPYLDSPSTTFVGGSGLLRGKDAIEAQYRGSYFESGAPAQSLRFAELEVRMLGERHALVLGGYRLFDTAGARVAEGPFSLVFALTPEGWRIVHDHSS